MKIEIDSENEIFCHTCSEPLKAHFHPRERILFIKACKYCAKETQAAIKSMLDEIVELQGHIDCLEDDLASLDV